MKTEQRVWTEARGWNIGYSEKFSKEAELVFIFSGSKRSRDALEDVRKAYPNAHFAGCSTAGEIIETRVLDDSMTTTAVIFESTKVKDVKTEIDDLESSFDAGKRLAASLDKEGLVHILVFSDGLHVNGSELVNGILDDLPPGIGVTGGLAGDGDRFQETYTYSGRESQSRTITALGFYGADLHVGYGSINGFTPFGPERLVTKARGNVLYELDGQSALDLYKKYLGEEKSQNLATNQFYFPLSYRKEGQKNGVVRTILSIDEENSSMTFAGDISEGGYARLMKSTSDKLIDGASSAAQICTQFKGKPSPDLALLISCVGRKIILKQRTDEEIESVRRVFGESPSLMGFYSYGEIAHFAPSEPCQLHNQTMTVTTFAEGR